jgi:hypothetical protein
MKFEQINTLEDEEFRRLTGVKRGTFKKMTAILIEAEAKKKARGGKPNKQCMEDRLLMALEYLREYRTYFHIAKSYGISESACYRNVRWIEETLIQHPDFALPGRKELLKSDMEYEVLAIDATETAIERPKKSKNTFIQEKRRSTA